MGLLYTKIAELFKTKHKILMIGLDGVGKTTILHRMKTGELVETIPTIGFNVETVVCNNISLTVWDVGGGDKIRELWGQYLVESSAVIFVVNATDHERINEVREGISRVFSIEESSAGVCLLILLNKQDQPNAMNSSELTESLKLNDLKDRKWHIQPTTAITGAGILEGLEWLSKNLKN
ncbi:potential ADP-ribosylation factor [Heterostelium album PN500]|uniref:Potential ADP-ribosylation factor n=1 Tax=Heterostelium pallidum (strain ATCC 26659 / Pp 5 / PN500) TaxID=670386 RepID=D3B4R3_HETP5|nr:potential ADP-ribosylation factor [Heterostelium album PN500]EFA84311.1 potential ADP-ribosylation factor [Heterostelium album PN500]|eukprot:XP_020436426.1 potential ADP-ribosylation factor [Heterostelium album PN500]